MSERDDGGDAKTKHRTTEPYESEVPGHVFTRCPECGAILHLGPGWRGRDPPLCPECSSEEQWDDDPRVTMQKFLALVERE